MSSAAFTRTTDAGLLASTFVGVIEPLDGDSAIKGMRRLTATAEDGRAYAESTVALEVTHADGTQDLLLAADAENPLGQSPSLGTDGALVQPEWGARLEGELCLVRRSRDGAVMRLAAANTSRVRVAGVDLRNDEPGDMLEWRGRR